MPEQQVETDFEEFPTCPVCGFADQDWPENEIEGDLRYDGDKARMTCACGARLEITLSVEYSFSARVLREGAPERPQEK